MANDYADIYDAWNDDEEDDHDAKERAPKKTRAGRGGAPKYSDFLKEPTDLQDAPEGEEGRNDEIVALLHQVGQRLITSEQDRKHLKAAMNDLQERSEQSERAFLTIQDRLHKTESAIEKRQRAIEKMQSEQMVRIEKASAMADKIEDAIAQHSKINRRLDKVSQDRVRLDRKLDRIEEAVIDTQDALNAKAMVLLTEQQEAAKNQGAVPAPSAQDEYPEDYPWWKQQTSVRAGAITLMILLGLGGGWLVGQIDLNRAGMQEMQVAQAPGVAENTAVPPSFEELADYESAAGESDPFAETLDRALNEEPGDDNNFYGDDFYGQSQPETTEQAMTEQAGAPDAPEDMGRDISEKSALEMSDNELATEMQQNPAALAEKLNAIEPGTGPASVPDEPEDINAEPVKKAEPAAFTPPNKPVQEMTTADFIAGQKQDSPLRQRIASDEDLPPVIKEVERKAYEGVKEAQHDLAAIYTAGHGGVDIDYSRAAKWFRESAIQGVANARYNLGVLYHQGLGVDSNINTAVNWYRAAADMGHPEAQYNLGIAYIEGVGARYNPEKAAFYFERAADQGILEAAYNLGLIHENGLTGDSAPNEALYWYKKATEMGSPEAKIALDQLADTLGLYPEDIERMYGEREKEQQAGTQKRSMAPADQTQATTKQASATPQNQSQRSAESGIEYIEAQPLNGEESAVTAANNSPAPRAPRIAEATSKPAEKSFNEDHALVAQVQEQLIRLGLYPGPANGVNDALTQDAIRSYQNEYDLSSNGHVSQALLVHMMTSDMGVNEYGSSAE